MDEKAQGNMGNCERQSKLKHKVESTVLRQNHSTKVSGELNSN